MITLRNGSAELSIEEPGTGYCFSRFDWTGKIVHFSCNGFTFGTSEIIGGDIHIMGRGFFNEFGIADPIAYEQTSPGGVFPKPGVGYLEKDTDVPYSFIHPYSINPFEFTVINDKDRLLIQCLNRSGDYPFFLEKEILLTESGFSINYTLENRGKHLMETSEYIHNFLSPGQNPVLEHSQLIFNGEVNAFQFEKGLNPDNAILNYGQVIEWLKIPQSDFFYENISQSGKNETAWTLSNQKYGWEISETVDFIPDKINLWGCSHVVSPEVFKKIQLQAGAIDKWKREFKVVAL
jgi:hypothetical protein